MYNFDSRMESTATYSLSTSGISFIHLELSRVARKFMEHYPTCFMLFTGSLLYQCAAYWWVRAETSAVWCAAGLGV